MEDGKAKRMEKVFVIKGGERLTDEEREEMMRELRAARLEEKHARDEAHREMRFAIAELANVRGEVEEALKEVEFELMSQGGGKTVVEMKCEGEDVASHRTLSDGTNVVMLCKSKVMAEALNGLKEARAEIASDKEMDAETRAEVLRVLDEQIKNWNKPRKGA